MIRGVGVNIFDIQVDRFQATELNLAQVFERSALDKDLPRLFHGSMSQFGMRQ